MTLQNSNSGFTHRSLVLHFRCLLGGLGHHFGSFGRSFWEPKSFILGPWGALGTQKKPILKKTSKKIHFGYMQSLILESILASFFDDFLVVFSVRFLDHFWSHFGAILGATMEPKSIKNRFKSRSKFQSDF